jgi:hypothetical protein
LYYRIWCMTKALLYSVDKSKVVRTRYVHSRNPPIKQTGLLRPMADSQMRTLEHRSFLGTTAQRRSGALSPPRIYGKLTTHCYAPHTARQNGTQATSLKAGSDVSKERDLPTGYSRMARCPFYAGSLIRPGIERASGIGTSKADYLCKMWGTVRGFTSER